MKQCPACDSQLYQGELTSLKEKHFVCLNKQHNGSEGFTAAYNSSTDEIRYFFLSVDKYNIENCYIKNRTKISITEADITKPFLYLPLIHFELYDREMIKKKLKLLVMMY